MKKNQIDEPTIRIARMSEIDLNRVAEIEAESNLSFWGRAAYAKELKRDDALLLAARERTTLFSSAVENEVTVGFVALRLITPEAEILNIAVKKEFRRRGIGALLLGAALNTIKKRGCEICRLEVRESNGAALEFYDSFDFKIAGRRKKYYADPIEDALVLEMFLN